VQSRPGRMSEVSGRTARGAFLQPGNTLSSKRSGFVWLHLRRPSYCGGNLHKRVAVTAQ
jgi:hypothetical protein